MARLTIREVIDTLAGATDPEMGISIVDLGLVYGIKIDKDNNIDVKLTMTSPLCPLASIIIADVQLRLERLQKVGKVNVELVWEPPWSPEMISEQHRLLM